MIVIPETLREIVTEPNAKVIGFIILAVFCYIVGQVLNRLREPRNPRKRR